MINYLTINTRWKWMYLVIHCQLPKLWSYQFQGFLIIYYIRLTQNFRKCWFPIIGRRRQLLNFQQLQQLYLPHSKSLHVVSTKSLFSSLWKHFWIICLCFYKLLSRCTAGKPIPNKRGRKPLSRMPETVSHSNFQICNVYINYTWNLLTIICYTRVCSNL
jgi:hypothetical protein